MRDICLIGSAQRSISMHQITSSSKRMSNPLLRAPLAGRRLSIFVLILLLGWLLLPIPALAHSQLVDSDPAAGALLDTSPQTLRLEWSESVSLQFSSIKVYDRTRKEQRIGALGQPAGQDTVIKASLLDTLPAGTYTVVWRVVSGADGHLTAGSFAFRVKGSGTTGDDLGPVAPDETFNADLEADSQAANPFRWTVRALILSGAILLLGGALFIVGVANPTIGDKNSNHLRLAPFLRERTGAIGTVVTGIVILALLLDLVAQVMSISSSGFFEALNRSDIAWDVLTGTRYGLAWFLKFFAAIMLGGIMLFVWRTPRNPDRPERSFGPAAWDIAAAAGSLLILGQSLSSHAAAIHITETVASSDGTAAHATETHALGLPLPVIADWVHMLAASLWAGGLLYMTLVLFPTFKAASYTPDERKAFLAKAIPRFSRLAVLGVVVLAVTGTYSTILHTADLGVLLSTGYGWVLAVKVIAFLVLISIGAINILRLSPALDRSSKTDQPQTALMGNVRGEAGLVTLALICAAGLTLLPPPADASSQGPTPTPTPTAVVQTTPVPTPGPSIATTVEAGYGLTLTVRPSLEGDQFTLNVINALGAAEPLTDVAKVLFRVTPQDVDGGSISYEAQAEGEITPNSGTWTATEPVFTLDGEYLVTSIVQRTVAPDLKAGFYLNLNESSLTSTPVGIVDIRLSTDPSPPISGTATLRLDVRDGTGQPVEGARITVNPLMPAHAHIEPPGPAEPVAGEPGIYTFPVRFIMGGSWLITFNVERDGQPTLKTDASLDVIGPEIDLPPSASPTPSLSP
jgi:putative copper export protein/methionine-rich copper-binding protein CopC